MRVENLRIEKHGETMQAVATIVWENCGRPAQDLYFGTTLKFADRLACNPHAFLVACIVPAFHFGEDRVLIREEICPELKEGLSTVMNFMRFWFYDAGKKLPEIDAETTAGYTMPPKPERAGVFLSGGIDAFATLRANRLNYPLNHPGSIKDGLLVYGLEVYNPQTFTYVLDSVSAFAEEAEVTLVPVFTNLRKLGPQSDEEFWGDFWLNEFMGPCFASIGHAFAKNLTRISINSSHDIRHLIPYSSHPLIDPYCSSADLTIRHEGIHLSRLEKTKLVADWDLALKYLRVCNKTELYQPGMLNCGKCEKCVRTMLALSALGVLEKTPAFPVREVTEELVMKAVHLPLNTVPHYEELLAPLEEKGRHDLVRVIKLKIAEYEDAEKRKKRRKMFIEPILEYDEKNLNGVMRKIKRKIFPGMVFWSR